MVFLRQKRCTMKRFYYNIWRLYGDNKTKKEKSDTGHAAWNSDNGCSNGSIQRDSYI